MNSENIFKLIGIFLISMYGKIKGIWNTFLLFFLVNSPYWIFNLIYTNDVINQSELSDTYNENDRFYVAKVRLNTNNGLIEITKLFLLMNRFGLCAGQNAYRVMSSRYKVSIFKVLFEIKKITSREVIDCVSESEFSDKTKTCVSDFGAFPKF